MDFKTAVFICSGVWEVSLCHCLCSVHLTYQKKPVFLLVSVRWRMRKLSAFK